MQKGKSKAEVNMPMVEHEVQPVKKRLAAYTEEIVIHKLGVLFTFGMTTIRIDKARCCWTARCAGYSTAGNGIDLNDIVSDFVEFVRLDIVSTVKEVEDEIREDRRNTL